MGFRTTVLAAALLVACGPALKEKQEFTPKIVRQMLFDDACQLQSYFDAETVEYDLLGDHSVGAEGHRTAGHVRYQLSPGRQTTTFVALLRRIYRRLPALSDSIAIDVTVPYHTNNELRWLPIGAKVVFVPRGGKEIALPYHPCLGAYFFGDTHYRARRKIMQ